MRVFPSSSVIVVVFVIVLRTFKLILVFLKIGAKVLEFRLNQATSIIKDFLTQ
jgi:hypothetical protein